MNELSAFMVVVLTALGLQGDHVEPDLAARPVLWTEVAFSTAEKIELVGVVAPSVQTNHAFRLLGQLMVRNVSVGDFVTRGQVMAAIDPTTFDLSVRAAQAAFSSAEAQLANANSAAERQSALLATGVTTQAYRDVVFQQLEAANGKFIRAQVALQKAQEQLGYTQLTAEHDGVVIAAKAEIWETISPGLPVVVIADTDNLEIIVDFPDTICDCLPVGTSALVSLELDPSITTTGVISEVAPIADTLSRAIRARLSIDVAPADFRLGATVLVTFIPNQAVVLAVPDTAILTTNGNSYVWVIDETGGFVTRQQITLGDRHGSVVEILNGVVARTRIVVAGVHNLEDQQPIRLGEELMF